METIDLTEGEMSQLCVSVDEGQLAHERNVDLDFTVMFGSLYTGGWVAEYFVFVYTNKLSQNPAL